MKNLLTLIALLTAFCHPKGVLAQPIDIGGTTRAVVIGISDYQNEKIPDLRFADRDAEAFVTWLQSPAGGSLPSENVMLLTNGKATNGRIIAAIDWLMAVSKKDDQAIIYFSGHGDVETKTVRNLGFLLTYDSPPNSYLAGAYPIFYLQVVMETLADKGAQAILIADACHAGKLAGNEIRGTQVTAQNLASQFGNEVKIMSCQPNEFSLEGEQWGGGRGAFSYHLIDGLYGMADSDADQQVTLREITRYLEDNVSRETAPQRQSPYTIGDPYLLLATVDAQALAALKKLKNQELPILDKIETKGLEEILLADVDTGIQDMYRRFTAALDAGSLLEPKDSSAYDLYLALSKVDTLKTLHGMMRRNLAAAFQDDAQQAINAYLEADSAEVNALGRNDPKYHRFPVYLEKAAELLGPQHYAYNNIMCKMYYFLGLSLKLNPSIWGKRDSILQESINLQKKALEYEDRAPWVYKALGDCYYRLGKDECLMYYDKSEELAPEWVLPLEMEGLYYTFQTNEYNKAEATYKHALEIDSTYAWAYYRLGQLYQWRMQKIAEAEAMYKKAIQLDSSQLLAPVGLSQMQADVKGDLQGGIDILKTHQQWRPNFYMYHAELGRLYEKQGELEKSEIALKKAVELNPSDRISINQLATLYYLKFNQPDEGEKVMMQFISSDTSNPTYYNTVANFYSNSLFLPNKAIPFYLKSLVLDSTNSTTAIGLAKLYAVSGNYSESIETLQKYLPQNEASMEYQYSLAMFLKLAGRLDEAIPYLEKVIKEDPISINYEQGPGEMLLGEIYLAQGRTMESKALFHKILEASSSWPYYAEPYISGRAYLGLQDIAGMKSVVHSCQEKRPDDPWVDYMSACLHSLSDQKVEALQWLEGALKKGLNNYGFIMTDYDLKGIMQTEGFKVLMKKYFPNQAKG